jgi:hypothetical protein
MLKNKLLSIVFLGLTGLLYPNLEIKLLDQENIDLVKEKADIYSQCALDHALSDNSALVCFFVIRGSWWFSISMLYLL